MRAAGAVLSLSLVVACAGRQHEPVRGAGSRAALPRPGEYITRLVGDFRWSIEPGGISVTSTGVRHEEAWWKPHWWEKPWGPVPMRAFQTGPLWVLTGQAPTGDTIDAAMLLAQDGAMWIDHGSGTTRVWRTRDMPKELLGEWSVIEPHGLSRQPTRARVHVNAVELVAPDSMERFDATFVDGPGDTIIALGAYGDGLQLAPGHDVLRIAILPWSGEPRPTYTVARGTRIDRASSLTLPTAASEFVLLRQGHTFRMTLTRSQATMYAIENGTAPLARYRVRVKQGLLELQSEIPYDVDDWAVELTLSLAGPVGMLWDRLGLTPSFSVFAAPQAEAQLAGTWHLAPLVSNSGVVFPADLVVADRTATLISDNQVRPVLLVQSLDGLEHLLLGLPKDPYTPYPLHPIEGGWLVERSAGDDGPLSPHYATKGPFCFDVDIALVQFRAVFVLYRDEEPPWTLRPRLRSELSHFCDRARLLGHESEVDADHSLTHIAIRTFMNEPRERPLSGTMRDWLECRSTAAWGKDLDDELFRSLGLDDISCPVLNRP